jgi:tetratricopeptide (TPR) repeat protein
MEFEEVSPSSEEESAEEDGSDAEGEDESSPDLADPDPSTPPEPDPVRSTLEVITDPGEATVTIRNQETGTTQTEETPATFEVPPGLYSWTVEKEGYAPKESRQAVNLKTQREQTERIDLVSVSGGGAYLERGDRAYEEENYQRAIALYEQVANPGPNEKPDDYLRAQAQLGRIYWQQQENYESAIQAYQNIIDYDNTRYEAFLNLARINYETESYEKVLDHLNRVDELKYRIPAQNQKRQRISLRVRSLRGRALFRQAQDERTRNRRAKALRANQEFQGFLDSVPPELESTFQQEISEIQGMEEEVRTLLREEIR